MNRECSVSKRILTPQGLRYCPVVLSANGRVKPDAVLINGKQERHPEGSYYISWYEGKRLMRLSVGKDASTATARRLQKEAELNATNNGLEVTPENGDNGLHSLAGAVTDFLEETKLTKKPKTLAAYTTALDYFQESAPNFTSKTLNAETSSSSLHSCVMRRIRLPAVAGTSSQTSCPSSRQMAFVV